ncbi:uncharacterized protein EI97DRAFT_364717, partial [Westerdykella ornata]
IHLTHDAQRLYWPVEGSWETAIRVMQHVHYDPSVPLGPYLHQETAILQSPLTEPKISSVTVRVQQLECWEDEWMEVHGEHDDPGEDGIGECGNAVFGPLDDYDPDSDGEGLSKFVHLLRCCGADRPRKKKASLVVKASGEYLTIHDYVVAVHPWLLRLRDDILAASGDLLDSKPLPADTKLVVWYGLAEVDVLEDKEWRTMKAKWPL